MTAHDKEGYLQASLDRFVAEQLNGRYREHVSDAFLSRLLFTKLRGICYSTKPVREMHLEHPYDRRSEIAYHVGCPVFELILEHHCRAGGNGHHVAQSLAAWMEEFSFPEP